MAVGAPFHSDYTTEGYESGIVYMHYQRPGVGGILIFLFNFILLYIALI